MASYFGMSEDEIASQLAADPEINSQLDDFMENTVVPTWRRNSPDDSGDYDRSVQVTKAASKGKGQVGALDEAANVIEYGSLDTPEFAPRARTEAQLNR